MKLITVSGLLVIFTLAGLADSLYFTLVYYRIIAPDARWIPSFCRMQDRSCRTVLKSPFARVFGAQNSVYGIVYYIWILVGTIIYIVTGDFPFIVPTAIVCWGVVLFSFYLLFGLLFRLKTPCPLCFAAHGINLGIAILMTILSINPVKA